MGVRMTDFERDGKVSIWVFRKPENPEDAEKDVLKDVCGVDSYDSDFQKWKCCVEPVLLLSLLAELSYSGSFVDAALAAAHELKLETALGVIAQFNFEYDPSKVCKPFSDDPLFLGAFDWHDWAATPTVGSLNGTTAQARKCSCYSRCAIRSNH